MDAISPKARDQEAYKLEYTDAELRDCLNEWVQQINKGSHASVAALYSPDATLLATFDPKPLTTPEARLGYFIAFKSKTDLTANVDECFAEVLGQDAGSVSGLYTFTYKDDKGTTHAVPARFTYVYQRDGQGDWKIISHHSSVQPSKPAASAK